LQIVTDLTAAILGDPHGCGRRRYTERQYGGAEN
jgi:hypothetical protein